MERDSAYQNVKMEVGVKMAQKSDKMHDIIYERFLKDDTLFYLCDCITTGSDSTSLTIDLDLEQSIIQNIIPKQKNFLFDNARHA